MDFAKDERQFILGGAGNEDDWITSDGNIVVNAGLLELRAYTVGENLTLMLSVAEEFNFDVRGPMYFYGRIVYVDERGEEFCITRMSIFRRVWDLVRERFMRTGNPDYEYAE